jgi:hypothetical protein
MSPRSKVIHHRLLSFLAALFLTLTLVTRADDAVAPAPATAPSPATTATPPPGAILPAVEPKAPVSKDVQSATTTTNSDTKPDASADEPLPPVKPVVVHADRDGEIEHLVGVLMEENHYLQTPISQEMSQRWLKNYFQALDPTHLFFLQTDVDEFTNKYANTMGDLIHGNNEEAAVAPAFEIFNRYMQRLD